MRCSRRPTWSCELGQEAQPLCVILCTTLRPLLLGHLAASVALGKFALAISSLCCSRL